MEMPSGDFEIQFTKEENTNRERLCMEEEGLRQLISNAQSVLTFSASFYEGLTRYEVLPGVPGKGSKSVRSKKRLVTPAKDQAEKIFRSFIRVISSRWRLNSQVAFILRATTKVSHLSNFKFRPHLEGVFLFKNNAVALPHVTGMDQWMNYEAIARWWGAKPEPAEWLKLVGKQEDFLLTKLYEAMQLKLRDDEKGMFVPAYLARRDYIMKKYEEEIYHPSYNIGGCECAPLDLCAPLTLEATKAVKTVIERIRRPKELKQGRPQWKVTRKNRKTNRKTVEIVEKTVYGNKPSERDYHLLISENLYCFIDGYEPKKHLKQSEVYKHAVEASKSLARALKDARDHFAKPKSAIDPITGEKYSYTAKTRKQRIKDIELITKHKEKVDLSINRIRKKIHHQNKVLEHSANPRSPWLHNPRSIPGKSGAEQAT